MSEPGRACVCRTSSHPHPTQSQPGRSAGSAGVCCCFCCLCSVVTGRQTPRATGASRWWIARSTVSGSSADSGDPADLSSSIIMSTSSMCEHFILPIVWCTVRARCERRGRTFVEEGPKRAYAHVHGSSAIAAVKVFEESVGVDAELAEAYGAVHVRHE